MGKWERGGEGEGTGKAARKAIVFIFGGEDVGEFLRLGEGVEGCFVEGWGWCGGSGAGGGGGGLWWGGIWGWRGRGGHVVFLEVGFGGYWVPRW